MTIMLTAGGRVVDLAWMRADTIEPEDIAHHLAQINRFVGACRRPYCVAEHSLLVLEIIERECGVRDPSVRMAALTHDAHEAYTQDVSQPAKEVIGAPWRAFEDEIQRRVLARFGLLTAWRVAYQRIKWADLAALSTERAQLLPDAGPVWPVTVSHPALGWVNLEVDAHRKWGEWRDIWLDRYCSLARERDGLLGAIATTTQPPEAPTS